MRKRIAKCRSQAEWARTIGEQPQAVSMMLISRDPSGKVLDALGLEKSPTSYRRIRGGEGNG